VAGDGAKGGKGLTELVAVDGVVEVLDVEVDTLVLGVALLLAGLPHAGEVLEALSLLLGTGDIDLGGLDLGAVQGIAGLGGSLVVSKVDKAKAAALGLGVLDDDVAGDSA